MQPDTTSPPGSSSDSSQVSSALTDARPLPSARSRSPRRRRFGFTLLLLFSLGFGVQIFPQLKAPFNLHSFRPNPKLQIPPLAMVGGDPYLRALMRTISASEANDSNPYNLLYGGTRFQDYRQHPDQCLAIQVGPNVGQCTTAAGRYQFLSTTWQEKAKQYHPNPSGWWLWTAYPFDPEYQDQVVYRWLSDRQAWDADIPQLLSQGDLPTVLRLLSSTWTSLGYGIEDNDMTPYLGRVYDQVLHEELKLAQKQIDAERQTQSQSHPN